MNTPLFELTGDRAIPWLFYDQPSQVLVAHIDNIVRSYGDVRSNEFERLRNLSSNLLEGYIRLHRDQWVIDTDGETVFNAWFAVLFAGLMAGCDSVYLGPRAEALDIAELSKGSEAERNLALDRDADCVGTLDDHILILLPPLDAEANELSERAHRVYHINTATMAMVPPRPLLFGSAVVK